MIASNHDIVARRFGASSRSLEARGWVVASRLLCSALLALSLSTSDAGAQTWTWPPPRQVPWPTLPDGRIVVDVLGVRLAFDPKMEIKGGNYPFTSIPRPPNSAEPVEHSVGLRDVIDKPDDARRFFQSADEFTFHFTTDSNFSQLYAGYNYVPRLIGINIRNVEKNHQLRTLERYVAVKHFEICCDLSGYASRVEDPWHKIKPDEDGFYVFSSGGLRGPHGSAKNNLYLHKGDYEKSRFRDATIFYCGHWATPGYCYMEYRYSSNVTVTAFDEKGDLFDGGSSPKSEWLNREARLRALVNSLIVNRSNLERGVERLYHQR